MTKTEIFQIIKKNILTVLPSISPDIISADKYLKELGANSIDRMEIVTLTLEDLELKVPLVEIGELKGIQGLIDYLYEKKISKSDANILNN